MRKVLNWGVVPLNLKGHAMTPHSLCWAMTNAPELVSHFNHTGRGEINPGQARLEINPIMIPNATPTLLVTL